VAEITKNKLISDDALSAPQQLANELQKVVDKLDAINKAAKDSGQNLNMADSIKKIQVETAKLTGNQVELDKVQKSLAENNKKRAQEELKSLDEMVARREHLKRSIQSLKKDQAEDLTLLKQHVITRAEYNKRMTESNTQILTMQGRLKGLTKDMQQELTLTKNLGGEYAKLTTQLSQADKKYRDLQASGKANSKELLTAAANFARLDKQVRAIDESMGKFSRSVGNYPKMFGAVTSSIMQLVAAFGLYDGIRLAVMGIKNLVTASMEYESQNSRLSGLLERNRSQMESLRDMQIELASSTLFTASQYAELQIELAKLGFTYEQIEKMTESTAKAAIAMGSDIGRQAELTGSILHQFNLDANQTTRVNDALTKSTVKSALSFEKLATSMPYVGAAASALGFSLEETLALMGQLSNAGLASSTVGTSLRKIFLLLADSSSSLSKKFKEPVRDLPSLLKGLKELKLNSTQLGEALELTDIRSVVAFQSLIDGADKVGKLNEQIQDSAGFTNALAKTMKDNLLGDTKLATAAMTQLGIAIGTDLESAMRLAVQSFTAFIRLLIAIPKFLKENTLLMGAMALALVGVKVASVQAAIANGALTISLNALRLAYLKAFVAIRDFSRAMLASPLGLVLLGISGLIAAYNIYDKSLGRTAKTTEAFNKANKVLSETLNDIDKDLVKVTVNEKEYMRLKEHQIIINEGLIEIDKEKIRLTKLIAEAELNQAKAIASRLDAATKAGLANQAGLRTQGKGVEEYTRVFNELIKAEEDRRLAANDSYQEQLAGSQALIDKLDAQLASLDSQSETYKLLAELKTKFENEGKSKKDELELETKFAEGLIKLDSERLKRALETSKKISDNENQSIIARNNALQAQEAFLKKVAKNEYELALSGYKLKKKLILDEVAIQVLTKEEGDKKIKDLDRETSGERTNAWEKYQNTITEITQDGEDDRAKIAYQAQVKQLKDATDLAIIDALRRADGRKKAMDAEITAIQQQAIEGKISKEDANKEIEDLEKNHREIMLMEAIQYQETLRAIEMNNLDAAIDAINKSSMAEVDKTALIVKLKKDSADKIMDIDQQIYEYSLSLSDARYANTEKLYESEIEFLQKVQEAVAVYGGAIANFMQAISDRRVEAINAEIEANREFYKELILLAGENEEAKDKLRLEAERKEQALEKRRLAARRKAAVFEKALAVTQAGISTALAVLNALSTVKPFIPNGVAAAVLAGALGAVQVATILAKPLPQYEKGGKTSQSVVIAGEAGAELYRTPGGDYGLTPHKATVMNLPVGTEIYPHEQSMRMIAMQGIERGAIDSTSVNYGLQLKMDALIAETKNGNKKLEKALRKNSGKTTFYRDGSLLYASIEDESRNKKLIRQSNLGK
jgi:TP901 family phage tail tape measure protein